MTKSFAVSIGIRTPRMSGSAHGPSFWTPPRALLYGGPYPATPDVPFSSVAAV